MNIVFDLDGVIRDLTGGIKAKYNIPTIVETWHWQYKKQNIFQWIEKDLKVLQQCPPTEYFKIIKKLIPHPEIWTNQLRTWIPYTEKWLSSHFKKFNLVLFENPTQKFNYLCSCKDTILVEDFPNYPDYTQVILIDRLYNRHTDARMRITKPAELERFLVGRGYARRTERH